MKKHKKLVIVLIILLAVGVIFGWWHYHHQKTADTSTLKTGATTSTTSQTSQASSFDKHKYSIDDSASLWVVVNKTRPLSPGYVPANLVTPAVTLRLSKGTEEMMMRADAAAQLKVMFTDADAQGAHLLLASGYRSELSQRTLHAQYVSQEGAAAADTDSARAGYSEHQTGLAVDVGRTDHQCEVEACFANTAEGRWIAANAYKYGFVVRYPEGKQPVTGYIYEPWHIRYVGTDLSTEMHNTGQTTLEEFFGLPAAPDYK